MANPESIPSKMIAPCGMNCGICYGRLREKNVCSGCKGMDEDKPVYCRKCIIRNCWKDRGEGNFYCFRCEDYPCKRLKALDKRYRTKYHMSMLENLENIRERGIRQFVKDERERWRCSFCGGVINVHKYRCSECGEEVGG